MTATLPGIAPRHVCTASLPFDFIGTPVFVERLSISEKCEGLSIPQIAPFSSSMGYSMPAYFVFVKTRFGDLRITVSKEAFDLLEPGDPLVVSYRRGRWTGALEGKIAR